MKVTCECHKTILKFYEVSLVDSRELMRRQTHGLKVWDSALHLYLHEHFTDMAWMASQMTQIDLLKSKGIHTRSQYLKSLKGKKADFLKGLPK
jgi:hypothetical protein